MSIEATATGAGYWMIASDGGVFTYGDARFHGSTGGIALVDPIVSMTSLDDRSGYWLVSRDGGVFAFGAAGFYGSAAGRGLPAVVDIVATSTGRGYWLVDEQGGIHRFGDAHELATTTPPPGKVAGAAARGNGLNLVWDSGVVDRVHRQRVNRTALATMRTTVDIAVSSGGTSIAATGPNYRRIGPSIGGGGAADVAQFAADAQVKVGVVSFYATFKHDPDLPTAWLDDIHDMGALPMITWEPWDPDGDLRTQPEYQLRDIIEGRHDEVIDRWARQAAGYGKPIMMRFAHEMNGDWYPWSELVNDNRPGDFVAAWRYVHAAFERAGAHNVVWVWNPNVETPWSIPMAQLYPGADVVDYAAIDGYNAGSALPWGGWRSASSIIGNIGLPELRAAAPGVPVIIGETSSTESGGSKSQWISEMFEWLERDHADISMVIWFDESKETSWNVGSSDASRWAFATFGADQWCGCRR